MKLEPVTKLKNKIGNVKTIDDDFMLENSGVVVIFPIYGQFGTIWKLDFRHMVCKVHLFINGYLLSYKS